MYASWIKRTLDVILSLAGLILLSWLFLLIAIVIFVTDPGPVIFTQYRLGKDKQKFKIHKFRTMYKTTPHNIPKHLLKGPNRFITPVGHFLRRYSLDELPQLWDILVGNMSVVGPRPVIDNMHDLIAAREKNGAYTMKPGLTGLAQINGRDRLTNAEKAYFDGEYVKKFSFKMDLYCFNHTLSCVLRQDGYKEGAEEEGSDESNS